MTEMLSKPLISFVFAGGLCLAGNAWAQVEVQTLPGSAAPDEDPVAVEEQAPPSIAPRPVTGSAPGSTDEFVIEEEFVFEEEVPAAPLADLSPASEILGVEEIEIVVPAYRDSGDDADEIVDDRPRVATLRALEKITARITDIDVQAGETATFRSLSIDVQYCNKRPPEETPETTALMSISETKPDGSVVEYFKGWMFASSPGLSALEHPVYDVWVMDCKIIDPEQVAGSP